MSNQYNNELTVAEINKLLDGLKSPCFAHVGKRKIQWFMSYITGGGYSTSIGLVRRNVACLGDSYDSDRLDKIIAAAHDKAFFA